MESILDNQFNLVYLDVPWLTRNDGYFLNRTEKNEDSTTDIKKYIATLKNCDIREITLEDVKKERLKRNAVKQKEERDDYGEFIAKILENAMRILDEKGMLVFRAPADSIIDYKLMLDQVFSNSYVKQITLEMAKRPMNLNNPNHMNHELLYFYSKSKSYTLNKVFEKPELFKDNYNFKDERGRYRLNPILSGGPLGRYSFTWKEIIPSNNLKWIYNQEKLNELFEENKIVIKEGKAYIKRYMEDNPREKSSVWKASPSSFFDIKEKWTCTLMAENFIDLLNMVTNENDWIFSPFDLDQKFPVIAQNMNRKWVTINSFQEEIENYKAYLDKAHYDEVMDVEGNTGVIVYNSLMKNIDDIQDLKLRLNSLNSSVASLKNQLGLEGENEETIIEKIQEKIDELIDKSDIEYYIPVVEEWIRPYWDKLEPESKWFLPTAELLFEEYTGTQDFDLSTAIMPYCKSLEKEIYTKMFKGYIKNLVSKGLNVNKIFQKDFTDNETKKFAEAVNLFTTRYKNNDNKWHFELGRMVYILRIVLNDTSPYLEQGRIFKDFKNFLVGKFEYSFFDIDFLLKLDVVVKLRNDSAHPRIVTPQRIQEGKEITKQKIIELLKFHQQ